MRKTQSVFSIAAVAMLSAGLFNPTVFASSSSQHVTINWLTTYSQQAVAPLISGFEKAYPNITVNVESVPFGDYFSKVVAEMQAKSTSVDVLSVDAPEVPEYTVRKYILPMNSYFPPSQLKTVISPAVLQSSYYKGTLAALPQFSSSHVLYYNVDIFKAHHITPPSATKPWTWEQVAKAAQDLTVRKNGNTSMWGLLFEQVNRPYELLPLPESLGANPLDFKSNGWLKSMNFYYDLFNVWKVSDPSANAYLQTNNLFASGHAAMFAGGEWDAVNWAQTQPKLHFAYAPYPYFQGGTIAIPTDSWHDGIAAYSQHIPQDVDFIRYLTMGQGAVINFNPNAAGNIPAYAPLLKKLESGIQYSKFPTSVYQLAAKEAHYAVARPETPFWDAYQTITTQMFTDISTGTKPETALQAAEKQWAQTNRGF